MRIWLKWIGIVILIPIVLILLLSILLYIPSFQNVAIKKVTDYAGEATGMTIGVEKVRLSFPLNLTVHGVEVLTYDADTILTLQSLTTSVRLKPLFKKQVYIDAFDVKEIQLNSGQFIDGMLLTGYAKHLSVQAEPILLTDENAVLKNLELSDGSINLRIDSTSQDTTSTKLNWVFLLENAALNRIAFAMQMPADSLNLATYINSARLTNTVVSLPNERYSVEHFVLSESSVNYDGNSNLPTEGFDPLHVGLSSLNASIDTISYCGKDIYARIASFSTNERSGLEINTLSGVIRSDSTHIDIPELVLKTAYSDVRLLATVPWTSLDPQPQGNMRTLFTASVGKEDVLTIVGGLSAAFKKVYPDKPILLTAGLEGNMSSLNFPQVKAQLPGAFKINMSGKMQTVLDSIRRSATFNIEAESGNLNFLLSLLPAADRKRYNIPRDLKLWGNVALNNQEYQANLQMTESSGRAELIGRYNLKTDAYQADLKVDSLEPVHFMPTDSLLFLTATMQMEGKGLNIYSSKTWSNLQAKVKDIHYGISSVSNISMEASLKENQAKAELTSDYPIARMHITFDGTIQKNLMKGMLIADVDSLDLYKLHFLKKPMATSFQIFSEVESDLKKDHKLDVTVGNWNITLPGQQYNPKTLTLHARSNKDTTQLSLHAGDLSMILTGNADLEAMTNKFIKISKDIDRQLVQDSTVNITTLRPLLPEMTIDVSAKKDNPIYNIFKENNILFDNLYVQAQTSPEAGLTVDAGVQQLYRDTFQIDMINLAVRTDTLGLTYVVDVVKSHFRKQEAFTASIQGVIQDKYADGEFMYLNEEGETGLSLGVRAYKEKDGMRLRLYPNQFVLGFARFNLNPNNYVLIKNAKDIEADVHLIGPNNASLWVHSIYNGALPELHAELSQINLEEISKRTTYLPGMKGLLSADFQYAPSEDSYMALADINIDNLIYEDKRVGELMFNMVYLPIDDNNHQIDVHMSRDRNEIGSATAHYKTGIHNTLVGSMDITNMPMEMLTPFVPDGMAELYGTLNGSMNIKGVTTAPKVNGFVQLDSGSVYVAAAASSFRFDKKRVEVKDNIMSFNKYHIYASGDNPFVIDGTIDMKDPMKMTANMNLNANNLQLLDVKRTPESLVYGKMLVNIATTLKGPLDALNVRGEVQLLGATDMAYVLRETPLTVEDRLKDLVTFTYFVDTIPGDRRRQTRLPIGGMDIQMTIHIDPVVKLRADISPDQSSYVDLQGGGDLIYQYTKQGETLLNGRYTLSGGKIKYALPVIPLKEFTVKADSYVEWTGNMMDPILNLHATERMRSSVSESDGSTRMVNFDVGIELKERLENMALKFTLDAPEDMEIKSQLASKGAAEREKLAVSMMVTGMYMDNSKGGKINLNMGTALTGLLQSEINNLAGSTFKNIDFSFGIDNYTESSRTDFSFRIGKRFYNDRIRAIFGGHVSTNSPAQTKDPFIDNVALEYLLDPTGSRYTKIFYQRNFENLLENQVYEGGVGIVLKRKMLRFYDLFDFKKKKVTPVADPQHQKEETDKEETKHHEE